jgi:hypothetical protein
MARIDQDAQDFQDAMEGWDAKYRSGIRISRISRMTRIRKEKNID